MTTEQILNQNDWVDIKTLLEEYNIEIDCLAEIIEKKDILTRGRSYDEINQRDQSDIKLREIPHEYWCDGLVQEFPDIFLYIFKEYGFQRGKRDIQIGYVDIEVNRKSFETKALKKGRDTKPRKHKHMIIFKELYDEFRQEKNWVSPDAFFQHILDEYDDFNNDDDQETEFPKFSIISYDENPKEPRKSELFYSIDGNPSRKITLGRIHNITSRFNRDIEE